jgi:hypothetical protein
MSDKSANKDITGFWSIIDRLYGKKDDILKAANRLLDYADKMESVHSTDDTGMDSRSIDGAKLRSILTNAEKEMNAILSYASELEPHLSNKDALSVLSEKAHLLTIMMMASDRLIYIESAVIAAALRTFAQVAVQLRLNPTKKSLKYAFGIDVGSQWAKIRAQLEKTDSNY